MTEVIHTPHGQEHPYQQLPEERVPRQPLAGAPFTVGIVTRPSGAVNRITIHQSVNGNALPDTEAVHLADWTPTLEVGVGSEYLERITKLDQDVWEARLTAPPAGETLTYAIKTDATTEPLVYTLGGETWQSGGGVSVDGDTMRVSRDTTNTLPQLSNLPALEKIEWLGEGSSARRVRLTFSALPDERFFGLGERFNALDQRGNVMDIRCYEQYKNQDKRAYMPIPFLLTSAGYAVWVESSRWMQFDLAATSPDQWTLEAELGADETLNLHWFTGSDPLELIGQFSRLTGPAALPPDWAFGLWMSSNEWNSQPRVVREVEASEANGISPAVMVIEAWSDESTFYIWNDAQYTPKSGSEAHSYEDFSFPPDGKWTDPKGMIDWLHDHGVKLILWQIPVMKVLGEPHAQHDADRAHFEQAGLGVHDPDGKMHKLLPSWFRGGYVWDATNPEARDWWFSKRDYLLDIGVDGFKTDGGEHLWGTKTVFYGGRRGDELWNEYPLHYTEAYYNFANSRRPGLTFSRAGFTGSQRAPAHWAGDEHSTWEAYQHSILAGLSAGISGVPFWGWDIGGFSGELPTAELYLRSTAMAAFCPIMQYHSEFNQHKEPNRDRTPWNIQKCTGDERVIPTFRFFTHVRHNLMPYIWQEAQYSAQTGQPMMQALKLWHSEASDYQYFFGRDLLVSPVVEADTTQQSVYLPSGDWYDLWTEEKFTGGQTITVETPIDRIPVFVRGGASIPVRLDESQAWGEPTPFNTEATRTITFG